MWLDLVLVPMRSLFFFGTQVLTSTHEGKAHDYDFDHDGLADEDTEKHGDLGPLIDRANPLYSSPAPSVDTDANIIPLQSAWIALQALRLTGTLNPFGPITAQVHRPAGTGEDSHVDAAYA